MQSSMYLLSDMSLLTHRETITDKMLHFGMYIVYMCGLNVILQRTADSANGHLFPGVFYVGIPSLSHYLLNAGKNNFLEFVQSLLFNKVACRLSQLFTITHLRLKPKMTLKCAQHTALRSHPSKLMAAKSSNF